MPKDNLFDIKRVMNNERTFGILKRSLEIEVSFAKNQITSAIGVKDQKFRSDIDQATSTQDLDEAGSVVGCTQMHLETSDSSIAKRLHEDHALVEFKTKGEVPEAMQEKKGLPMLTGRQIAFTLNAFLKFNDVLGRAHGHDRRAAH